MKFCYMKGWHAILSSECGLSEVNATKEDCLRIFRCVLDDFPGVFWVQNGFRYVIEQSQDDTITHSIFFTILIKNP